jgi:hypothetical protein
VLKDTLAQEVAMIVKESRGGHLYLFLKPRASKFLTPYLISLNLYTMTKKKLCVCSFIFEVYTLNYWNFCMLK